MRPWLPSLLLLLAVFVALPGDRISAIPGPQATPEVTFGNSGYTLYGDWQTEAGVSPRLWEPGTVLDVTAVLRVTENHWKGLAAAGIKADGLCLLITAERTFDGDGRLRLASDERMSTLITPTGLAIEGGVQGAVTKRFGTYGFSTPVDVFLTQSLTAAARVAGQIEARFQARPTLPADLPAGIYRVRLDYGVTVGRRYYGLNGDTFARRPFFSGRPTESHIYSPPIRANGIKAGAGRLEAAGIQPRVPWVLLAAYNSNGYSGVVADEDKPCFALSGRSIIPDEVILPLYDDNKNKLAYSLEPQFPTDTIELRSNIPWDYRTGELSIQVTGPDGKTTDLGTAPFVGANGQWPTTKRAAFTAWRPPSYGYYTVTAAGWIKDVWGNRYEGGGAYHFWIARRMTLATATFQGQPYPVGGRYGRDIGFAPAVPADVQVDAALYVNSDPNNARTLSFAGKASPAGIFSAAQGNQALVFDAPGEYHGHVLAQYTDRDKHLWVCSMRHSGVVYTDDSPIVARGKKLTINGKYLDRGETHFEGWVDTATGTQYLAHITFPYNPGDVLLIASEQQGANKIEPTLIWEDARNPAPYQAGWQGIGLSNIQLKTSNGYSPHLYPEYITDWAYYYAGAPRPGFMSRFLVGEDGLRAPYWPTSPNSFGGQINASANGDLPGDLYRLLGGVVLRRKDQPPAYAGYMASAFLLPKKSDNNRVIVPGSEDLNGPAGEKARFFLVGTRPGMTYEVGTAFAPAVQIDPMVPANITFVLQYPDGRTKVAQGRGDKFGSFVGTERWTLDVPGVYRYTLQGEWNGYRGGMPGLPDDGGHLYVIEKTRPADGLGLRLTLPDNSLFPPDAGILIGGFTTAEEVYYAAVMPGAVIDQGTLPVHEGQFYYALNPTSFYRKTPTYDIYNLLTGRTEIKDVIHLTFFSREYTPFRIPYHSFCRLIIRGNRLIYAR